MHGQGGQWRADKSCQDSEIHYREVSADQNRGEDEYVYYVIRLFHMAERAVQQHSYKGSSVRRV